MFNFLCFILGMFAGILFMAFVQGSDEKEDDGLC